MRSHLIIFFFLSFLIFIINSGNALYGISADSEESYNLGEIVTINVVVPENSTITVQITNPNGHIVLVESTSSENGSGRIHLKANVNQRPGKYKYFASSISEDGEDHAMTTGSFRINEEMIDEDDELIIPIPEVAVSLVFVGALGLAWASERSRYYLLALFFVPLYTRLKRDAENDVFQLTNRARIYQHIKEQPGTGLSNIRRSVETGNGTTVYHLKVLERENSIIRKGKQYFIKGVQPHLFGKMDSPFTKKQENIVKYLKDNQISTEKTMSNELSEKIASLNRNLKYLMNLAIVHREKTGGVYNYSLTPSYKKWCWEQELKALEAEKTYCPYCGVTILMPGAVFCKSCGKKIS